MAIDSIDYRWADDTHRYYRIHINPPWTWEDYRKVVDTAVAAMAEPDHLVALIVELGTDFKFPPGDILANLRYLEMHIPENVVASIVVGAPYIATTFLNIFMKLRPVAKRRIKVAKSMAEAITIANERFRQLAENAAG